MFAHFEVAVNKHLKGTLRSESMMFVSHQHFPVVITVFLLFITFHVYSAAHPEYACKAV